MTDIVEHYDQIWRTLGIPPYLKALFRAMEQVQLNEGSRILDVACGNGTFGKWFMNRIDVEMYGLDISPVAVDLCKKEGYQQVELADLDRDPMPYLNDFFDLAILSAVLEHVMSPGQVLREVWKKLKPGGKIVILTPNVAWILNRLLFMLGRWDHPLMGGTRGHISYMNKAQLASILQQDGYENIDWTHSVVFVAGGGKISTKGLTGLIARILDGRRVYKWQSLWALNFIVIASKPKQPLGKDKLSDNSLTAIEAGKTSYSALP